MSGFLPRILSILLLSLVFVPGLIFSAGYPRPDDNSERAGKLDEMQSGILYSILDLRFGEADSMLELAVGLDPGDPENHYLRNYLEFLDAMISGERRNYEKYLGNSGERIKLMQAGTGSYSGTNLYISSIHLQSSVISAYHRENFKAARHFHLANRYLKRSEEKDLPGGMYFRNKGLIVLGVGSVPEEYRWLLKVLGMRGEIDEGLECLGEYYSLSKGARRTEACLINQFVFQTLDTGYPHREGIEDCPGDSLTLSIYAAALTNLASGNSERVTSKLENYSQGRRERDFPYLDLIYGEALLNGLDADAGKPLERFTRDHSGIHYRHFVWHKLSWCYLLSGDSVQYKAAREKVIKSGEAYLDADRQALNEALELLPLNQVLLQARLLFDGGYYLDAMDHLRGDNSIELRNRKDSIEYNYRLARIFDRLGESDLAIRHYEDVVLAGSFNKWYFAPNAALQLGIIHESIGDTGQALEYYRKCLKINKSAYQNSIDFKARQGIRRLED